MKVSVIVPCYNHGRYVEQCLRSIDAQDCDDLDVIIIDDGSTDDTWQKITSFPWSPHRRVRMLSTPNQGAHVALNRGLDLAEGRYVALCNSDDWFAPNRLSTLVNALESRGARFAFSQVRYHDDNDNDITTSFDYAADLFKKQNEIATFPSVGFSLLLSNTTMSTGNFVFERSLVDEIGYFRPYRYCHDWDFVLRALLITEPVYVPEPLYFYRLHPSNSFKSLDEAAAFECPELMTRYMKAAHRAPPANKLAPSPHNWPVFFDVFIQEHKYEPYCRDWSGIDLPYYRPPHAPLPPLSSKASGHLTLAPMPAAG